MGRTEEYLVDTWSVLLKEEDATSSNLHDGLSAGSFDLRLHPAQPSITCLLDNVGVAPSCELSSERNQYAALFPFDSGLHSESKISSSFFRDSHPPGSNKVTSTRGSPWTPRTNTTQDFGGSYPISFPAIQAY